MEPINNADRERVSLTTQTPQTPPQTPPQETKEAASSAPELLNSSISSQERLDAQRPRNEVESKQLFKARLNKFAGKMDLKRYTPEMRAEDEKAKQKKKELERAKLSVEQENTDRLKKEAEKKTPGIKPKLPTKPPGIKPSVLYNLPLMRNLPLLPKTPNTPRPGPTYLYTPPDTPKPISNPLRSPIEAESPETPRKRPIGGGQKREEDQQTKTSCWPIHLHRRPSLRSQSQSRSRSKSSCWSMIKKRTVGCVRAACCDQMEDKELDESL